MKRPGKAPGGGFRPVRPGGVDPESRAAAKKAKVGGRADKIKRGGGFPLFAVSGENPVKYRKLVIFSIPQNPAEKGRIAQEAK